ncbi:hypothetical protein [Erythrobacter sp. JK5]|uniref:hypothetical protein n=1 Tax=Erythrobacter sp. JK5 TaxID=2829500 RepID=UPI001BAA52E6|nr:hypothetical protein [Erythrobacter sp. JK5]QUL38289.1 hypothetical protein KDC96_02400 [Erythrobacter sp. JK5]
MSDTDHSAKPQFVSQEGETGDLPASKADANAPTVYMDAAGNLMIGSHTAKFSLLEFVIEDGQLVRKTVATIAMPKNQVKALGEWLVSAAGQTE